MKANFKIFQVKTVITALVALLSVVMPLSCERELPENLEPRISLSEADGISRTGAVLHAVVVRHGVNTLDWVKFRYWRDGGTPLEIDAEVKNSDMEGSFTATAPLTDLSAGCEYKFLAFGGRGNATVYSETLTFKTLPNTKPAVSGVRILSQSPVSVFIAFDITDDGGSPLTSAGCTLCKNGDETPAVFTAAAIPHSSGMVDMALRGLEPGSSYTLSVFAANGEGETVCDPIELHTGNSVTVGKAGELEELLGEDALKLNPLAVSGPLDGSDFRFIRSLCGAGSAESVGPDIILDISGAVITEGGGSYDGSHFTAPSVVTNGLLANCPRLSRLTLPASAIELEAGALDGTPLRKLTVPASMTVIMPSIRCNELEEITVDAANTAFKSHEGVLFDYALTAILWLPPKKGGSFTLPVTVESIGPNTFYGSGITSIVFPDGLKELKECALAGTLLQEVTLPDGVTLVGKALFQDSRRLATVRLGGNVDYISDYAFDGTPLKDLYIGRHVPPYLTEYALFNSLTEMTEECTLHVPAGSKPLYRNHRRWGAFSKIVEY